MVLTRLRNLLTIMALIALPAGAEGASVTFAGSMTTGGYSYAATATFATNGNDLIVTLMNTATQDVLDPARVLTAVFFHINGDPTLTPISAEVPGTRSVVFAPPGGAGPDVGMEWAYKDGLSVPGRPGFDLGISSSGLGLFGPQDLFTLIPPGGQSLQGPDSPNGLQYGITAAGDNMATGNSKVTGSSALIKDSVLFRLAMGPDIIDPSAVTGVDFQYGTSLTEVHMGGLCMDCGPPSVPEPGTLAFLLGGALALFVLASLRRRAHARTLERSAAS
jgi:hypothetical protein